MNPPQRHRSSSRGSWNSSAPISFAAGRAPRTRRSSEFVVEAFVEGVVLKSVSASLQRQDLADAGLGDGRYGFVVNFDVALSREDLAELAVYGRAPDGERHRLRNIAPSTAAAPRRQAQFDVASPLPSFNSEQHPVFVLGAKRSGTSAIAQALLRSGRYAGQEEGHLLGLAGRLIELVGQHYEINEAEVVEQRNSFITRVPEKYFTDFIKGVFAHLAQSAFPSGYWLDKTPDASMVRITPLLKDIWPNAKFVFMKRRGVEHSASRARPNFPTARFRSAARIGAT